MGAEVINIFRKKGIFTALFLIITIFSFNLPIVCASDTKACKVILNTNDTEYCLTEGSWTKSSQKGYGDIETYYSSSNIVSWTWSKAVSQGKYKAYIFNKYVSNNTSSALVIVEHTDGCSEKQINQQENTGWIELGTYCFTNDFKITLKQDVYSDGVLRASAVKLVPIDDSRAEKDGSDVKNEVVSIYPTDTEHIESMGLNTGTGVKTESGNFAYYFNNPGYVIWSPEIQGGKYKISYYACGVGSDSTSAEFKVNTVNGMVKQCLDTTTRGWKELGEYVLYGGKNYALELYNSSDGKSIRLSDVKFERICTDSIYAANVDINDAFGKVEGYELNQYNKSLSIDSYVVNDTSSENKISIFAARYDNGELSRITSEEITVLPYTIKRVCTQFGEEVLSLSQPGGDIKLFLWDSKNMYPLNQNISYNITQLSSDEIYVSKNGAADGDGSFEKPYASIEEALNRAAECSRYRTAGDVTIYLRGGTYYIDDTLEINSDDFNTENKSLTIQAYNGENVIISGGKIIGNWEKYDGKNMYRTYVGEGTDFRQLYKNGEKQVLARKPNLGVYNESTAGTYIRKGIPLTKGYIDDVTDFENQNVLWTWVSSWMNRRYKITSVDKNLSEDCDYIMFDDETDRAYSGNTIKAAASNGYFEGAYEFIDIPGEWVIRDKWLYYMAYPGENPNDYEFIYPVVQDNLIRLCGNVYNPVRNITFRGIEFSNTNWTYPNKSGMHDIQANTIYPTSDLYTEDSQYRKGYKKLRIPAAICAEFTQNISIQDCIFKNIGGTGTAFLMGNDGVNIIGNQFFDIAGSAIEIGDDYYRARDSRMYPKDITVSNNYIHNVADEYRGGCGITAMYVDGIRIEHNYIKDVPYSGISVGWGWDNSPPMQHRDFFVKYNVVENAMQELYDGGFIYSPDPINGTNIMEGNVLIGNEVTMNPGSQQQGFYFDASSSNWNVKNNVVLNIPSNYAVRDSAKITIENFYTNNTAKIIWSDSSSDKQLIEKNFISDDSADWSVDYDKKAFNVIKNAGLENEYKNMMKSEQFEMYYTTPNYHSNDDGTDKEKNVSVIVTNKTNETYNAIITLKLDSAMDIPQQSKEILLHPGDNRIEFVVTIKSGIDFHVMKGSFELEVDGEEKSIPIYFQTEPEKSLIVTVHDEGYKEIQGNWSVSGLPDTRCGSAGEDGYAIAQYIFQEAEEGIYDVLFYGVPNGANGLNPHQFVVYDKEGVKKQNIYQRTIPAGWNYMGTFEWDKNSCIELWQTGGGTLRTSSVALSRVKK